MKSKSLEKILKAADAWPKSCGRYLQTYDALVGTKFTQQAFNLLTSCTKLDRNNFQALNLLQQFNLPDNQKVAIKQELHRLDPLNPNFK